MEEDEPKTGSSAAQSTPRAVTLWAATISKSISTLVWHTAYISGTGPPLMGCSRRPVGAVREPQPRSRREPAGARWSEGVDVV